MDMTNVTETRESAASGGTSVHFAPEVRAQIEAWRAAQPAIPSLRAAVDVIVRAGLHGLGYAPKASGKAPRGGVATAGSAGAAKRAVGK